MEVRYDLKAHVGREMIKKEALDNYNLDSTILYLRKNFNICVFDIETYFIVEQKTVKMN